MKLLIIAFFSAIVGLTCIQYFNLQSPADILIGLDESLSVQQNCADTERTAKHLAGQPGVREGSKIALLLIGNGPNDPEPKRVFDEEIPFPSDAVYGRDDGAFEKRKSAFFQKLRTACEAAASTQDSPVLRMVKRGTEHLRVRCGTGGMCYLSVKTDLEDTVDTRLAPLIARSVKDPSITLPPGLAGSIDNTGIRVTFCGAAEVRARRSSAQVHSSPETLTRLWKGMFTHPELVSMQPFCGGQ